MMNEFMYDVDGHTTIHRHARPDIFNIERELSSNKQEIVSKILIAFFNCSRDDELIKASAI